ncbi:low temperature requirement protein A [Actinomadura sp. DLS-62]|uniref:Low temperature requirement protein A n=1 Tax=Actinomadura monticuli TaxID=3097367 RepID=A0ABV4QHF0_9ACTN
MGADTLPRRRRPLTGGRTYACLWLLYFSRMADAAEQALERAHGTRRAQIARDAYTLIHFPLIAKAVYIALGVHEVLAQSSGDTADRGEPLEWTFLNGPDRAGPVSGTAVRGRHR